MELKFRTYSDSLGSINFRLKDSKTGEMVKKNGELRLWRFKTTFGREKRRREYLILTMGHSYNDSPIPWYVRETLWRLPVENVEGLYEYDGYMLTKEEMANSIIQNYPIDFGETGEKTKCLEFHTKTRKKMISLLKKGLVDWLELDSGLY